MPILLRRKYRHGRSLAQCQRPDIRILEVSGVSTTLRWKALQEMQATTVRQQRKYRFGEQYRHRRRYGRGRVQRNRGQLYRSSYDTNTGNTAGDIIEHLWKSGCDRYGQRGRVLQAAAFGTANSSCSDNCRHKRYQPSVGLTPAEPEVTITGRTSPREPPFIWQRHRSIAR